MAADTATEQPMTDNAADQASSINDTNDQTAEQNTNDASDKKNERLNEPRKYDRPDSYILRKVNKYNRSNYGVLPESKDEAEIRKQVEFYFSDSNLPSDQYLLKLTGGSANNPVPLKTIHNFKRMRHFQPYSAVRDAVKTSKFLLLSADDEITRKTPLSDVYSTDVKENGDVLYHDSIPRSLYVKGFGEEYDTTQLDIEKFFKPYGPFNSVRLRRQKDGNFKGSVFVEFATEDLAKQFLNLDIKPRWLAPAKNQKELEQTDDNAKDSEAKNEKGGGKELQIMTKAAYIASKNEGIAEGYIRPASPDHRSFRGPKRDDRGGRGRGSRGRGVQRNYNGDRDNWKERRNRDNGRRDMRSSRQAVNDDSRERKGRHDQDDDDDHKPEPAVNNKDDSETQGRKRSRDEADDGGDLVETKKAKSSNDKKSESEQATETKKRTRDETDDGNVTVDAKKQKPSED